jgi:hypothetical protein
MELVDHGAAADAVVRCGLNPIIGVSSQRGDSGIFLRKIQTNRLVAERIDLRRNVGRDKWRQWIVDNKFMDGKQTIQRFKQVARNWR